MEQVPYDGSKLLADDYSHSGPGSTWIASSLIRRALIPLFQEFHIHKMVDIPCGDMHWVTRLALTDPAMKKPLTPLRTYIGGDISTSVIEYHHTHMEYLNRIQSTLLSHKHPEHENSPPALPPTMNKEYLLSLSSFTRSLDSVQLQPIDLVEMNGSQLFHWLGLNTDLFFNRHMLFHLSPGDGIIALRHIEEYGRLVLQSQIEQCQESVVQEEEDSMRGNYSRVYKKCQLKPFFLMTSTSIMNTHVDRDYILLLGKYMDICTAIIACIYVLFMCVIGNIKINVLQYPYCMKHPLRLYKDGVDGEVYKQPADHAGTPEDMYMGLWTLHSPRDSLFRPVMDGKCG